MLGSMLLAGAGRGSSRRAAAARGAHRITAYSYPVNYLRATPNNRPFSPSRGHAARRLSGVPAGVGGAPFAVAARQASRRFSCPRRRPSAAGRPESIHPPLMHAPHFPPILTRPAACTLAGNFHTLGRNFADMDLTGGFQNRLDEREFPISNATSLPVSANPVCAPFGAWQRGRAAAFRRGRGLRSSGGRVVRYGGSTPRTPPAL